MGDPSSQRPTHEHADKDGHFRRKDSQFRDWISRDQNAKFPAEKGRYALYVNLGCPWAHRTILVRALKGLEDIIQVIYTDFELTENGWLFTGRNGSSDRDPLYGFVGLKQLYLKADPDYAGRYTVPTLWDKKAETIVNNESSEIIRMLFTEFDDLVEPKFRETNKQGKSFYPEHLRAEIDAMNEWVYHTINNGVYKCGFATSQEAYDANVYPLFASLDRVEAHLASPESCHGGPFLFGDHLTEADIRLYTTIARFDTAYHTIFLCNIRSIQTGYPRIWRWFRRILFNASGIPNGKVFKETTIPQIYRQGYSQARSRQMGMKLIVPHGPEEVYGEWTEDDADIDNGRRVALKAIQAKNGLDAGSDTNGTATPTSASTSADFANLSLKNTNGNYPESAKVVNGKTDLTYDTRESRTATSSYPNMGSFVTRGNGNEAEGEVDPSRKLTRRNTATYESENQKWYKAAKKAEKKSGAPNVHLAC
ncbi:hypothetical protein LTS08_000376 [Lithohypha guttulata]|uniref:uncharacterized protein n=1 Tax=Lithohypha guttulata TaxID=1690604 RepID=UPI002DDE30CE|nr:hypothetical protein LTR51_006740 [Lithohypha guttulata]KAK5106258.1 hypothetical protein LTS08_000376 [Lithohypha guttulata]